jgi:hypothetical protein
MSFFTNLLASEGADPRAMFGIRSRHAKLSQGVVFTQIDPQDMRAIFNFYATDTDVSHINNLKNSLSLAGGIELFYGEDQIDTQKFPVVDHICLLLKTARKWHDMFGFFAVCNPTFALDMEDSGVGETPEARASEEAREVIAEIGSRSLKARVNAILGGAGSRAKPAVERSRSLAETIRDLGRLRAVSLDEGLFYLQHDTMMNTMRVVFVRGAVQSSATPDIASSIDHSVYVHVWDGRMPSPAGVANTQMREVMRRRVGMDEAFHNKARADYWASHPIVFVEQEPAKHETSVGTATDADILDGTFAGHEAHAMEQRLAADIMNRIVLKAQADVQNGKVQTQLQAAISARAMGATQRNASGQAVALSVNERTEMMVLPPQTRVSSVRVEHRTLQDENFMRFLFRSTLSQALNFPLTAMDAGATFTPSTALYANSGSSVAANEQITERTKISIIADREVLASFFNNLWDIMYREIDTRTLQGVLANIATKTQRETDASLVEMQEIEERIESVTEVAEQLILKEKISSKARVIEDLMLRLKEIETRVREIVSLPYRFTIRFSSFSHLSPPQLQLMLEAGAISRLEYANTLRIIGNLPPLTEAEFEKNTAEKLAALEAENAATTVDRNPKKAKTGKE